MKKEKITTELYAERCEKCGKRITGYSEAQVNYRMSMHLRTHIKSGDKDAD